MDITFKDILTLIQILITLLILPALKYFISLNGTIVKLTSKLEFVEKEIQDLKEELKHLFRSSK